MADQSWGELRIDSDGGAYPLDSYVQTYGPEEGSRRWHASPVASAANGFPSSAPHSPPQAQSPHSVRSGVGSPTRSVIESARGGQRPGITTMLHTSEENLPVGSKVVLHAEGEGVPADERCSTPEGSPHSDGSSGWPSSPGERAEAAFAVWARRDVVQECLNVQRPPDSLFEGDAMTLTQVISAWWNIVSLAALFFNCFTVPASIVFGAGSMPPVELPYEEDGTLVTDRVRITANYLRGWFAIDIFAAFPWELIWVIADRGVYHHRWLRVNRLAALLRLPTLVEKTEEDLAPNANPVALQLLRFLALLFCFVFISGVLWGAVFANNMDEYLRIPNIADDGAQWYKCAHGFHWALRGMAGYGQMWPIDDGQFLLSTILSIVGVAAFASIVAYMQNLLALLGSSEQAYQLKLDELMDFLKYFHIPTQEGRELLSYYRQLWTRTRQVGASGFEALRSSMPAPLPPELSSEVEFYRNASLASEIPTVRAVADDLPFVVQLVSRMRHYVLPDGEVVATRGEEGLRDDLARGILFVCRGAAVTLRYGAYWGEVRSLFGGPHTATALYVSAFPEYVRSFHVSAMRRRAATRHIVAGMAGTDEKVLE
eukprot:gene56298-38511_t